MGDVMKNLWPSMFLGFMMGVVVSLGIIAGLKMKTNISAESAVADGYAVYLDGREVDPESISVRQYRIVVDDVKNAVYLAK